MLQRADSPSKREQIETALAERYPGKFVATGGFTEIAREVGASKAFVTRIARNNGFYAANPRRRSVRPEGCKHCGREVEPGKRVCNECNWVSVACDTCGNVFKRRRDRIFETERDERYQGGVYCSRECFFNRTRRINWRP